MSLRIVNILEEEADVIYVRDVMTLSGERLCKLSGFGKKALTQLIGVVRSLGLSPPEDWVALLKI